MSAPIPRINIFRHGNGRWRCPPNRQHVCPKQTDAVTRPTRPSPRTIIVLLVLWMPAGLNACVEKIAAAKRPDAPIRILAISPVISEKPGATGIVLSESPDFLSPETIVDHIHVEHGLKHIENDDDARMMAPFVRRKVLWAQREHYDAVVVKIMLNAALTGVDKGVAIPVVGPRDATGEVARHMGQKPAYIYPMGIMVADLHKNKERTFQTLLKEARQAVQNGADVLIIGCTGIENLAFPLRAEIDVPVLRNVVHALIKAERLAKERRP